MEELKKEDEYMNASFSISPEKYFDTRFDYQEKLFTEKFNSLHTQIDSLSEKTDSEIKALSDKIDAVDKRLSMGFSIIIAMLAILVALHFFK